MIVRGLIVGDGRQLSGEHFFWRLYYNKCDDGYISHGLIQEPNTNPRIEERYGDLLGLSCNNMSSGAYVKLLLSNLDYLEFGDELPVCDGKEFKRYSFAHRRLSFDSPDASGFRDKNIRTLYCDSIFIEFPMCNIDKNCISSFGSKWTKLPIYVLAVDVKMAETNGGRSYAKSSEVNEGYVTTLLHIIHEALNKEEKEESEQLKREAIRLRYIADRYDEEDGIK